MFYEHNQLVNDQPTLYFGSSGGFMSIDRRKFLKAGVGAVLVASLRTAGRAVLTRIVPVIARAVPRMRLNLLRFLPR